MRGLIENVPVQDIFCSGLGAIERLEGNCLRLYFYVSHVNYDGSASEKQIVAKLIVPASAVPAAVWKMIKAAGDDADNIIPPFPEMMH
jgi:hypothetical protein